MVLVPLVVVLVPWLGFGVPARLWQLLVMGPVSVGVISQVGGASIPNDYISKDLEVTAVGP